MKKVLFVANTLQVGGAEKILINVLKNIDKSKYDVTVLALVDYGVLVDEVKSIDGVKYIGGFKGIFGKTKLNEKSVFYKFENKMMIRKLKKYAKKIKMYSDRLYPMFIKEKYDIEIAFLEGRVSKFVSCSTNPESKKISWIHTDISNITPENFIDELDEKTSYDRFDKIVCVSNGVKDKFIEKTGIQDKLYVQTNPIDSNNILKLADENVDFKRNDNELIVCAVGRLEPVKGYDRLLRVHKRLINESISHQLWFIGDGKERANMESYIKSNNLEDSVTLFGYQKNPYKYMKNADVYICSSIIEGLSSTVLEAVILQKTIISTDCPGMKEILGENNENALIVNNNEESIYEGLKAILTDENLRKKYQENIKNKSKKFNLETTIKEVEDIIDK